jgi:hypothetical protein
MLAFKDTCFHYAEEGHGTKCLENPACCAQTSLQNHLFQSNNGNREKDHKNPTRLK